MVGGNQEKSFLPPNRPSICHLLRYPPMLNFIQHLLSLNSWKSKNFVVPKQTLQLLLMAKYKEALGAMLSAQIQKKLRREPGICHQL